MKSNLVEEELKIITQNVCEILPDEEQLCRKIEKARSARRPLKIKYGIDPTSGDIHLGHTVVLWKLRQLQDLGHLVFFIIGDFTARIGDPSGRDELRKPLKEEEILRNASTYKNQVFKILDPKRTRLVFNSLWLKKMNMEDILKLTSLWTVARILERAEFKKRLQEKREISILEFLYPLLQGYDSVALESDLEIGGTDQKFNLLVGRELQKDYGQESQVILTLPLLLGTDGKRKMSKSYGNYIGISESAEEIFGKTMSIPDELIFPYLKLLTPVSPALIEKKRQEVEKGNLNPAQVKKYLAQELVGLYHSPEAAKKSCAEFEAVFKNKEIPSEINVLKIKGEKIWIVELLLKSGFARSKAEANRLISQGGVSLNANPVDSPLLDVPLNQEYILKVGKRHFLKIIPA